MEYIIIALWVLGAWLTASTLAEHNEHWYDELILDRVDVAIALLWPLSGALIFCMEIWTGFATWRERT